MPARRFERLSVAAERVPELLHCCKLLLLGHLLDSCETHGGRLTQPHFAASGQWGVGNGNDDRARRLLVCNFWGVDWGRAGDFWTLRAMGLA